MKMRLHTRLVVAVGLTVFSILVLLPRSRVRTRLQSIVLGGEVGGEVYAGLWSWGKGADGGVRLVVFGDAGVDNSVKGGEKVGSGKGKSWTEVLCDEINCTSCINFGVSQPATAYPASPPTGALTSNNLYVSSVSQAGTETASLLPDFASQIKEFISLPQPNPQPSETIFVVSFGTWDIYHFASLDFTLGTKTIQTTIAELFGQLDVLHAYASQSLPAKTPSTTPTNTTTKPPSFRVVIPKVFDPTLLPGWITQRPAPLAPDSIAEQQKNAVYLTTLWNSILENKIGDWLQDAPSPAPAAPPSSSDAEAWEESAKLGDNVPVPELLRKDVFYPDLPRYLLDVIVEHQMEAENASDAAGLGRGESPFLSVDVPCVREGVVGEEESVTEEGFELQEGKLVCVDPDKYLFWEGFEVGGVAKEGMGKVVGKMVREGKSMRTIWEEGKAGFV